MVINGGQGYVSPLVRIIPDPDYPDPTLEAKAVAYLGSPEGDIYYVNVADLNGSNTQPTGSLYSHRISQSVESSGGNFGSRNPSIDWNGTKKNDWFFALWWGFVVIWALYGSFKLCSIWRAPD